MTNNHDHNQCLVSESGHVQCDGPAIQKRDEEASLRMQGLRRRFALKNGAPRSVAQRYAELSDQEPMLRELCDFLIAQFNRQANRSASAWAEAGDER